MMVRDVLDDLAAFAVVARERSFKRAAAELALSTSMLSYKINRLEKKIGVRLLQRNSRSVGVSEAGERLLETLAPALESIGGALDRLGRDPAGVSGKVRITATRQAYEAVIRPVLATFGQAYPNAGIEVLIEYEFRDIIASRIDAGIRLGEKLEKDMIALGVGPALRMTVVGSPAYLARRRAPRTPHELTEHRCIGYRMRASGALIDWEFEREGHAIEVKVEGSLTVNEPELALDAALDGLGLAYVLERRARPHPGRRPPSRGPSGLAGAVSWLLSLLPVAPSSEAGARRLDRRAAWPGRSCSGANTSSLNGHICLFVSRGQRNSTLPV
jgi:DNA-binding transcriptional LysR family regulator